MPVHVIEPDILSGDRLVKGMDTTDDVIIDTSGKGFVLKDSNGHYWRLGVSILGIVIATDLGTTKP